MAPLVDPKRWDPTRPDASHLQRNNTNPAAQQQHEGGTAEAPLSTEAPQLHTALADDTPSSTVQQVALWAVRILQPPPQQRLGL